MTNSSTLNLFADLTKASSCLRIVLWGIAGIAGGLVIASCSQPAPPEQCEPMKLLLTLDEMPPGTKLSAIGQPVPDATRNSAGVDYVIDGRTVHESVFWYSAASTAQTVYMDKADFPYEDDPGVSNDLLTDLPALSADEFLVSCGDTPIGSVCSLAARYKNVVVRLQVETGAHMDNSDFSHFVALIDKRIPECADEP